MRLIDKVVQGPVAVSLTDNSRRAHFMKGPGYFAERVSACAQRFILDRDASQACASLFRNDGDLPEPSEPLARAPAQNFWLEFYADGNGPLPSAYQAGHRIGLLVETAEREKVGNVTCFCEDVVGGAAQFMQYHIEFDFCGGKLPDKSGCVWQIRHGDLSKVDELLARSRIVFEDDWLAWAKEVDGSERLHARQRAETAWAFLPMMICFNALLNSRTGIRVEGSDLTKINRARNRRGRRALLDHTEIKLDVRAFEMREGAALGSTGIRKAPRLHLVRGHMVHRRGKTFWRTSHFRGDGTHVVTRNVSVISPSANFKQRAR
ncbi:hypothetical protein EAH79_11630 [Sphingomonas koreensis]|nr:hypothetical protein EAH79_11630 [Sphingomonas koreensis]